MNKLIILLITIVVSSCEQKQALNKPPVVYTRVYPSGGDKEVLLYVIDSCEYIGNMESYSSTDFLTHKGNCKFCIERNNR